MQITHIEEQALRDTAAIDYVYDNLGRLTEEHCTGHRPLPQFSHEIEYDDSYIYDLVGNRLRKTHHQSDDTNVISPQVVDEIVEYAYDERDRLLTETVTLASPAANPMPAPSDRHRYEYGANGAQTLKAFEAYSGGSFVANAATAEHYRFDLRGRLAQAENVPGKLVGISVTGRVTSTMHYDHLNARVANEEQLGIYRNQLMYLVDHHSPTGYSQVIEQRRLGQISMLPNTLVARTYVPERSYVWGHGLISQDTSLMITDHHGTVRQVMLPGGIYPPVETFTFDAFGVPTDVWQPNGLGDVVEKTHGDTYLHRYTGEPIDVGIGLQFNRARWYDATSGVWTTMDSYEGDYNRPLTLHTRAYVHNDPVGFVDPSGREAWSVIATLEAILAMAQLRPGDVPSKKNDSFLLAPGVNSTIKGLLTEYGAVVKPVPELWSANTPSYINALSVDQGHHKVFSKGALTSDQFVGTGGAQTCVIMIVLDKNPVDPTGPIFVAHFQGTDNPDETFRQYRRRFADGSRVILAGGDDFSNSAPTSMALLRDTLAMVKRLVDNRKFTLEYYNTAGVYVNEKGDVGIARSHTAGRPALP